MCYKRHGTNGFTSHPKDEAMVKSVLLKDPRATARDSNPHSADQKHAPEVEFGALNRSATTLIL